jgi:hypothetical protein
VPLSQNTPVVEAIKGPELSIWHRYTSTVEYFPLISNLLRRKLKFALETSPHD